MARLLISVMRQYELAGNFTIHEYVVMPNHIHLLLTPASNVSLEHAIQLIKGGFSYRAKRELNFRGEVWQRGFTDHRIRSQEDLEIHKQYIRLNPVRRGLVTEVEEFPYSSACASAAEAAPSRDTSRHE